MHLLSVQTVEIDTIGTNSDGSNELVHTCVLGMRNGHTAADARTSQLFAFQNRFNDSIELILVNATGRQQCAGQFSDHFFFVM